ncbi:MAG: ImmA/IrrE family metallo-endopeptidase [Hyphomicrobiales bacterium]|nr:ImmA/IrrE family metallo-endopeptidase [Hyphomicrobiales bacterium]
MSTILTESERTEIEERADALTSVYTEPAIPVCEIARENGLSVYEADFDERIRKLAGFCDFKKERIYLNREGVAQSKNITAAHELGHWILHKECYDKNPEKYRYMYSKRGREDIDEGGGRTREREKQADYFARCLLVPRSLLRRFYTRYSVAELAEVFNVPRFVMEKRIKEVV